MQVHRTGPERTCAYCGATFKAWWPANPGRYCSRICAGLGGAAARAVDPTAYFLANIRRDDRPGACWDWTGRAKKPGGYGHIPLGGKLLGQGAYMRTHRYAWTLVAGPIPSGMHVLHVCDRPSCCRNDDVGTYEVDGVLYERHGHLWLGTHAVNMADMAHKGRANVTPAHNHQTRGEQKRNAKLTDDAVRAIRAAPRVYGSGRALAARYGVSIDVIIDVRYGRAWKHVT